MKNSFSATMPGSSAWDLFNTTVKFSQIITNDGASYDQATGIYTASQAGYYVFAFSVVTVHERYCNLCLRRNGICEIIASSDGEGIW